MGQKADRLELRQLVPDRGRGQVEPRALDEHLRADGLTRRHVLLDDPPQNLALARSELHCGRW